MSDGQSRPAAHFRFHGELECFLPREQRGSSITHAYARAATLKQAIEALGVPHTEVGSILVNGACATLSRIVRADDFVEVFSHAPGKAPFIPPLRFVADAHMGALARMLRMLGFDTLYDNNFKDEEIVARADAERRVVLTRDRDLLKCRDVHCGCYVHGLKAEAQLREVARRYGIERDMQPFSLCLHCNLPLSPAAPDAVAAHVPERIREHFSRFMYCPGCGGVFWEGSHFERMRRVLSSALNVAVS
jgi:uncharacterized protein with PIN domain